MAPKRSREQMANIVPPSKGASGSASGPSSTRPASGHRGGARAAEPIIISDDEEERMPQEDAPLIPPISVIFPRENFERVSDDAVRLSPNSVLFLSRRLENMVRQAFCTVMHGWGSFVEFHAPIIEGLNALAEANPVYAKRFSETIRQYSGAARYLEELQHTDLEYKVRDAITGARLEAAIVDRVRALNISEKKACIRDLQKQRRQARIQLNAGDITQEEFTLGDAILASEVQTEKEALEVLKQEASAAAAVSDTEFEKKVRKEVLAKHEKSISNTEAHLMSFSLL